VSSDGRVTIVKAGATREYVMVLLERIVDVLLGR